MKDRLDEIGDNLEILEHWGAQSRPKHLLLILRGLYEECGYLRDQLKQLKKVESSTSPYDLSSLRRRNAGSSK